MSYLNHSSSNNSSGQDRIYFLISKFQPHDDDEDEDDDTEDKEVTRVEFTAASDDREGSNSSSNDQDCVTNGKTKSTKSPAGNVKTLVGNFEGLAEEAQSPKTSPQSRDIRSPGNVNTLVSKFDDTETDTESPNTPNKTSVLQVGVKQGTVRERIAAINATYQKDNSPATPPKGTPKKATCDNAKSPGNVKTLVGNFDGLAEEAQSPKTSPQSRDSGSPGNVNTLVNKFEDIVSDTESPNTPKKANPPKAGVKQGTVREKIAAINATTDQKDQKSPATSPRATPKKAVKSPGNVTTLTSKFEGIQKNAQSPQTPSKEPNKQGNVSTLVNKFEGIGFPLQKPAPQNQSPNKKTTPPQVDIKQGTVRERIAALNAQRAKSPATPPKDDTPKKAKSPKDGSSEDNSSSSNKDK